MSGTSRKAELCKIRLDKARDCLDDAKILTQHGKNRGANNRAFHCIYHSLNAINALDGAKIKGTNKMIDNFINRYINTGIFPSDLTKKIASANTVQRDDDYDEIFIADKQVSIEQLSTAQWVLNTVTAYCCQRLNTRI